MKSCESCMHEDVGLYEVPCSECVDWNKKITWQQGIDQLKQEKVELLEACKLAVRNILDLKEGLNLQPENAIEIIMEAIAKAEGRDKYERTN